MFIKIEKILFKNLKKSGLKDKIEARQVFEVALDVIAQIVGEKAKVQIKPLRLEEGILYLACLSDLMTVRCKQFEKKIIRELNAPFFRPIVKKLVFEV